MRRLMLAMIACFALPSSLVATGISGAAASDEAPDPRVAGNWAVVDSPNVSEAHKSNLLAATTCGSPTECWAVGETQTVELVGGITETYVARWDGASWSSVPSPSAQGAQISSLKGVACSSATACWAVGSSMAGGTTRTLIEMWDGSSWSVVPSPNVEGAPSSSLTAVACSSASACWAVGSSTTAGVSKTHIQRWDGTAWSIVPSPNSSPMESNSLTGVACVSAADCWAVGTTVAGNSARTLVMRWGGATWSTVPSSNTVPAPFNFLHSVACSSAMACWAVGYYIVQNVSHSLILRWDGASWTSVLSPNLPAGQTTSSLYGVSCSSGAECWAVGIARSGGSFRSLIQRWDDSSWSIAPSPNTGETQDNHLRGVACAPSAGCWAVGMFHTGTNFQTLIQRWSGTAWSIVPSPNPMTTRTTNQLSAVACTSDADCWAVGTTWRGNVYQTLIEHWDGEAWAIVPSPNSSPTDTNALTAVTCVSASDCWSVGYRRAGNETHALIQRWDGASWNIVPSPAMLPTQSHSLTGVACVSATDCWAVGSYALGTATQTLIEHWDGTAWKVVSSPNSRPAQSNQLAGVTCASATMCWAVGNFHNGTTFRTLLLRWDGESWAFAASPNTGATLANLLRSATCVSESECWSVGYAVSGNVYRTLVQRWDGSSWSIVPSQNTSETQSNLLYGMTCSLDSSCRAVGAVTSPGMSRTLIVEWDGTSWKVVPSPNSSATEPNVLHAVDCASDADCMAVGNFQPSGPAQTLTVCYEEDEPPPETGPGGLASPGAARPCSLETAA